MLDQTRTRTTLTPLAVLDTIRGRMRALLETAREEGKPVLGGEIEMIIRGIAPDWTIESIYNPGRGFRWMVRVVDTANVRHLINVSKRI